MATEPNPDTPSAAELAEALRRLVAIEPGATIAAETLLAHYDAAQKSPLDALLAWAPGPWHADAKWVYSSGGNAIALSDSEADAAGHGEAMNRLLAAAPQMLDALRRAHTRTQAINCSIERLEATGQFSETVAVWRAVIDALTAAGDKP